MTTDNSLELSKILGVTGLAPPTSPTSLIPGTGMQGGAGGAEASKGWCVDVN